ncbi:MAG: FAD binding domain-containing protein [Pseudomonadota bacterium]
MKYLKPTTLDEALRYLFDESTRFPLLAGGTDLIVQWKSGAIDLKGVIDISALSELSGISEEGEDVYIGALVTHAMIKEDALIKKHFSTLSHACSTIGAKQIQSRGTIGGNVANASPAGDTPPVLVVYNCELELKSLRGSRLIKLVDLFEGYKKLNLKPDEIITRLKLPTPQNGMNAKFYKIGTRKAQTISKAALCVGSIVKKGVIESISIAAASMGPTVVTAPKTVKLLEGELLSEDLIDQAKESLKNEWKSIDDIRSTAAYRSFVSANILSDYLKDLL